LDSSARKEAGLDWKEGLDREEDASPNRDPDRADLAACAAPTARCRARQFRRLFPDRTRPLARSGLFGLLRTSRVAESRAVTVTSEQTLLSGQAAQFVFRAPGGSVVTLGGIDGAALRELVDQAEHMPSPASAEASGLPNFSRASENRNSGIGSGARPAPDLSHARLARPRRGE
jgi:hypothetical protein